jgi:hypothetical protein
MRAVFLSLVILLLMVQLKAQNSRYVGLMVLIEDSITHHFTGNTLKKEFNHKYPAETDYQTYAIDTALIMLEKNFPLWDFCTMDSTNFLVYEENQEKLRATDFRDFRESWFNALTEKYEVDAVLVIRNSPNFADGMYWSDNDITGYGIYNGPRRTNNNIYIQLEFLFYSSGRPLTHIQGPTFFTDKDYPRRDQPDDPFTEADLQLIEVPIKELIVKQIEAAIDNANLLRGLR